MPAQPTSTSSSSGSLLRCLGSNALFFVLTLACATALNYFIKDDIQTGYANKLFTDFGINVILAVSLIFTTGVATGVFSFRAFVRTNPPRLDATLPHTTACVMPGCEVDSFSPLENVQAMIDVARAHQLK